MFRKLFTLSLFFTLISAQDLCETLENNAVKISAPCLEQLKVVCRNGDLWWQFFDASAKLLTPGMSYTNDIEIGNFPQCMSIKHKEGNVEILGKYCGLATIIPMLGVPDIATRDIFKSFGLDPETHLPQMISAPQLKTLEKNLRDALIPGLDDIVLQKLSSCVPDRCTPKEVGAFFMNDLLENITIYTGITCETVDSNTDYSAGDIVMITFLVLVLVLILTSTAYDTLCRNFSRPPYHQILLSFSLLYNGSKLLQISTNKTDQIQIFNGMRFISMCWVVAYHAVSPFEGGILPLVNYHQVKQWSNQMNSQYIHSGLLAVDTFFFISGFLLAFSYLKPTPLPWMKQVSAVPKMYLHRYLRLTPAVGVMYLVLISIFRLIGTGPVWSAGTEYLADVCKRRWWEFFLYIQNYTNPGEMCVNPMWYLSADMQMFILAPLVLIPISLYIRTKFKAVMISLGSFSVFLIVMPMLVRYFYSNGDHENLQSTHDRFIDMVMGMTFGAIMRIHHKKPFIFKPLHNLLIWIVVLLASLAFNLYWYDVIANYDVLKYTLFMGFYRPIWCLCLTFMTYSCYHNHGGIVQWILERPTFQILGRLSYSMYVLHVMVEVYAMLTLKTPQYFSNYFLFYAFCGHLIMTMVLATIWVLAFEFPMLTIDKYLLGDGVSKWCGRIFRKKSDD